MTLSPSDRIKIETEIKRLEAELAKLLSGEIKAQPDIECYSRITGYYRPVKFWNAGQKAQYYARVAYNPPIK